jgi:hypothetical protein
MVLFSLVFYYGFGVGTLFLSGFAAARKADFLGMPGPLTSARE